MDNIELCHHVSYFVEEATKSFDDSHGIKHASEVYRISMEILAKARVTRFSAVKFITIAALCHDVCDAKYAGRGAINEEQLLFFIQSVHPAEAANIMTVIKDISYSKEVQRGKPTALPPPYLFYRNVVSDADKITAIGLNGILRCYDYKTNLLGKPIVSEDEQEKIWKDVTDHANEKLKRLYADGFIRTVEGREIAKPLHYQILSFIDEREKINKN